jgi:hypothetical protein
MSGRPELFSHIPAQTNWSKIYKTFETNLPVRRRCAKKLGLPAIAKHRNTLRLSMLPVYVETFQDVLRLVKMC